MRIKRFVITAVTVVALVFGAAACTPSLGAIEFDAADNITNDLNLGRVFCEDPMVDKQFENSWLTYCDQSPGLPPTGDDWALVDVYTRYDGETARSTAYATFQDDLMVRTYRQRCEWVSDGGIEWTVVDCTIPSQTRFFPVSK